MENREQNLPSSISTIEPQVVQTLEQRPYGKRNWKKWVIIYVVIALLFYGGVYYFFLNKSSNPYSSNYPSPTIAKTPTVIPTVDPTAKWKTYTNSKYGYVLSYPTDWSLVEQLSGSYVDIYDQPNITQPQLHDGSWIRISVSIDDRKGRIQSSDPIGTRKEIADKVFEEKIADLALDKYPAFKTVLDILPGSQTDTRPTTNILTKIGSNTFIMSFSNPDKNQYEKDLNIFNQILSTFKFIQ